MASFSSPTCFLTKRLPGLCNSAFFSTSAGGGRCQGLRALLFHVSVWGRVHSGDDTLQRIRIRQPNRGKLSGTTMNAPQCSWALPETVAGALMVDVSPHPGVDVELARDVPWRKGWLLYPCFYTPAKVALTWHRFRRSSIGTTSIAEEYPFVTSFLQEVYSSPQESRNDEATQSCPEVYGLLCLSCAFLFGSRSGHGRARHAVFRKPGQLRPFLPQQHGLRHVSSGLFISRAVL